MMDSYNSGNLNYGITKKQLEKIIYNIFFQKDIQTLYPKLFKRKIIILKIITRYCDSDITIKINKNYF